MTVPLIGVLVSGVALASILLLFRYEEKQNKRFFAGARERLDVLVLQCHAVKKRFSSYVGRTVMRQTLHYLFHRVLTGILRFLETAENRIKRALRANKSIARKLENSDRPKNKLDEIAEHKQSTALSEAEKKKHKQKSLEG